MPPLTRPQTGFASGRASPRARPHTFRTFAVPSSTRLSRSAQSVGIFCVHICRWGDARKYLRVPMQQRIDVTKVSPAVYQAVLALQTYVDRSGLDAKLRELIKIRASQREARKLGETEERMHLLDAWREPRSTARGSARRWAGSRRSRLWRRVMYRMRPSRRCASNSRKKRSSISPRSGRDQHLEQNRDRVSRAPAGRRQQSSGGLELSRSAVHGCRRGFLVDNHDQRTVGRNACDR